MNIQSDHKIDAFLYTLWGLQDSTSYGLQVDREDMVRKQSLIRKAVSSLGNVCTLGQNKRNNENRIKTVFQDAIAALKQRLATIEVHLSQIDSETYFKKAYQKISLAKKQFFLTDPTNPMAPRIPFYMMKLERVWNNTFGKNDFSEEKTQLQEAFKQFSQANNELETKIVSLEQKRLAIVQQNFLAGQLFLDQIFPKDIAKVLRNKYPSSKITINNVDFYFYNITVDKVIEHNETFLKVTRSNESTIVISLDENELPIDALLMLDHFQYNILALLMCTRYSSSEFSEAVEKQTHPLIKKRIVDYICHEYKKRNLFDIIEKVPPEICKDCILPLLKEDISLILSIAKDVRNPLLSKFCYELLCEYVNEKQCTFESLGLEQEEIATLIKEFGHLVTYFKPLSLEEFKDYIKFVPNLTHLNLSKCPNITDLITDLELQYLSTLINLQEIDLRMCQRITDQGLLYLQILSNLQSLTLDYNFNNITDQGLQYLQALPNLQKIHLSHCRRITDQGLQYLQAHLNLRKIHLAYCNRITDQGLDHLLSHLNLQEIDLEGCDITDQGLQYLHTLPNLQYIRLRHCPNITDQGRLLLRQHFPNVHLVC